MDLILASLDNVSLSTGLIQLIYCLLHTILLCQWDFQYKQWKCDIPSHVLQLLMPLKQWFKWFINQWCLINIQEMHFAHWSIISAKFRPLNCILKLRFQILTSPGIKHICWLWLSSVCRDIHFQTTAVGHEIKIANYISVQSEKLTLNIHVTFLFFVQYIIVALWWLSFPAFLKFLEHI